jgi:CheY-like chemotaxis protein
MNSGRLLLVDDDAALLDLLKRYLERLGYEVDACLSPEQALALLTAGPDRYKLVLTDLTLDGMNGEEMIDRMRECNPKLPAIISSGYPHRPRAEGVAFLQKPFLPKMLADAIAGLLRQP